MPLPELREDEAPPAIRAIYQDIRNATGTPQVNLIFRHLALEPAVLGWCWGVIAPLYRDGRIAAAVGRLHAKGPVPPGATLWQGMAAADAEALRAVLAFYDRGNSWNLLGLTTLLRARRGTGGHRNATAPQALPASKAAPLPAVLPLPRRDAIPPDILALVEELAGRQGTAAFGVLPSLWLHLTLWPDAVRRAHATIAPILGTPEWRAAVEALVATAGALADELADGLDAPQAPPDDVLQGYLRTVERFVGTAIPQMVLVGRILSGAKPAQESAP